MTEKIIPWILEEKIHSLVWLLMIKKELVGQFNKNINLLEDMDFYLDLFARAKSLYIINQKLYFYNKESINSLTKKNYSNIIDNLIVANRIIKDTLKKHGQNIKQNITRFDTRTLVIIVNYIYLIQYKEGIKTALNKYKKINQEGKITEMQENFENTFMTKKEILFINSILRKNYILFYFLCIIKNIKNKKSFQNL